MLLAFGASLSQHHVLRHVLLACRMKMDGPYDNRVLPIVLSAIMVAVLTITFGGAVVQFAQGVCFITE